MTILAIHPRRLRLSDDPRPGHLGTAQQLIDLTQRHRQLAQRRTRQRPHIRKIQRTHTGIVAQGCNTVPWDRMDSC
jgi:hypothetical protein